MRYLTSTYAQRAVITRRDIDDAYDSGRGTVTQWVQAFTMLGTQLRALSKDELDAYRAFTTTPCQCENASHFPDLPQYDPNQHGYLMVPAGDREAIFVGKICDACADSHYSDVLLPKADSYRLTPDEYRTHLVNSGDSSPDATMRTVQNAGGQWIVDASHGTVSYDSGWYWVRTNDLRVQI